MTQLFPDDIFSRHRKGTIKFKVLGTECRNRGYRLQLCLYSRDRQPIVREGNRLIYFIHYLFWIILLKVTLIGYTLPIGD